MSEVLEFVFADADLLTVELADGVSAHDVVTYLNGVSEKVDDLAPEKEILDSSARLLATILDRKRGVETEHHWRIFYVRSFYPSQQWRGRG